MATDKRDKRAAAATDNLLQMATDTERRRSDTILTQVEIGLN